MLPSSLISLCNWTKKNGKNQWKKIKKNRNICVSFKVFLYIPHTRTFLFFSVFFFCKRVPEVKTICKKSKSLTDSKFLWCYFSYYLTPRFMVEIYISSFSYFYIPSSWFKIYCFCYFFLLSSLCFILFRENFSFFSFPPSFFFFRVTKDLKWIFGALFFFFHLREKFLGKTFI